MKSLSRNHRTNFTLWKWKGFVAVITAIVFLLPAMALAQVPVVDAGLDQTIYLGDSAMLHGTATNDPGVWLWEVISAPPGSGYSLTDAGTADAIFSTDSVGDYLITLKAWNYFGWSDPDALIVTVVQNQPPTAQAAATPISGAAPLLVEFDGTFSFDPEGGDLLYGWTFDDGTGGSGATTSHTYDLPGVYYAALTVIDERGLGDFDIIEITVTPSNVPPTASPTATPNSGSAPLVVQFAANATDPDSANLTYVWDFGDPASSDNFSTLENPQHVYESPGTYTTWLTVSDGQNDVSEYVTVVVDSSANIYGCDGFEPPMDNGPVTVKKNRALPLKAYLFYDSTMITEGDITALPVLQVIYTSGVNETPVDVTDQALTAGQESDGNIFEFTDGMKLQLNLKLKNTYTAAGTYQLYMVSGDDIEYTIDPTCVAEFVIE